jgi:hypothetical protein
VIRVARDINGQRTITQSNGFEVMFDIVQDVDGRLHGSGQIIGGREANASGQLNGNAFVYTVDWTTTAGVASTPAPSMHRVV